MLTDKIEPIISNGVANIGGKDIIQKGTGTVIWYLNDYEGQLQTNKLKSVPYFTYSTLNILGATSLAESMKYDEVIWVPTKRKYSIFN